MKKIFFYYLSLLLPLDVFLFGLSGPLLVKLSLFGFSQLGALLVAERGGVVSLVPLTEGRGIDDDDGVLHQSLGTDQLVVGGIVDDVDDAGLASDGFGSPGEVTGVETESSVLLVSSADANGVDALRSQLGVGGGPGQLELSLHADRVALAARGAALVPMVARDTHGSGCKENEFIS